MNILQTAVVGASAHIHFGIVDDTCIVFGTLLEGHSTISKLFKARIVVQPRKDVSSCSSKKLLKNLAFLSAARL